LDATYTSSNMITDLLPHKAPWLLVDEVIRVEIGAMITTKMTLPRDNIFVCSHFGGTPPLVPGVLLIEFVAQSAHLLALISAQTSGGGLQKRPPLLARCKSSFTAPAYAEDEIVAIVRLSNKSMGVYVHEAIVSVREKQVCRIEIFAGTAPDEFGYGVAP